MKVGDYVRNQYGIAKLINIENYNNIDIYVFDKNICFITDEKTNEVKKLVNKLPITEYIDLKKIKSSSNIIDLIEVGDYVNGCRVNYVNKKHKELYVGIEDITIYEKDIKSIVTKEMFSSVEYRVETN